MSTVSEPYNPVLDYEDPRTYDLPDNCRLFLDRTPPSGDDREEHRKLRMHPEICWRCAKRESESDVGLCAPCLHRLRRVE